MEEKETQKRRQYAPKGERSGKMMSFRIDFENIFYLKKAANKGRLINRLIKGWAMEQGFDDPDADLEENGLYDYQP